jgi:DnaJ-class molecular chaperone
MNFDEMDDRWYQVSSDRNETITIKDCECCYGSGKIEFSKCCDVEVIDEVCQECLKTCNIYTDTCDECKGEGEIEIESNHELEEYDRRRDEENE